MLVRSLLCGVIAIAALSMPAWADVTGTVTVDGTVGALCAVTNGTVNGGSWGSINLQTLNDANTGKLASGLKGAADLSPTVQASVICNSAKPVITMTAGPMTSTGGTNPGAPASGYSNTINYVAHLSANYAAGGNPFSETYDTLAHAQTPVNGQMASPLSTTVPNITVAVNSLAAVGDGILVVSNTYSGAINITITPGS